MKRPYTQTEPFEWNRMKEHTAHALGCLIMTKGEEMARKMYETQWRRAVKAAAKEVEAKAVVYEDLLARFPHVDSHRDRLRASIAEDNARRERGHFAMFTQPKLVNTSPERIKELKTIMQQEHPDKGGDEDIFHAAKVEMESIRKALKVSTQNQQASCQPFNGGESRKD